MSIKIQINSLEALERLIGGDNELEIEIRRSVVENFSKKHLKAVASTEIFNTFKKELVLNISKEFTERTTEWGAKEVIKPTLLEELKSSLSYRAKAELAEMLNDAIEETKLKEKMAELVIKTAKWIEDSFCEENLAARINKLADAKIKERLGLS